MLTGCILVVVEGGGCTVPGMNPSSFPPQVFVNFAKDQSDDYHSKDSSVKRKDLAVDMSVLGQPSTSGSAAAADHKPNTDSSV